MATIAFCFWCVFTLYRSIVTARGKAGRGLEAPKPAATAAGMPDA